MRDIYSIYILFLVAVALRYAWPRTARSAYGVEETGTMPEDRAGADE